MYTSLDTYHAPFQSFDGEESHLVDFETGWDRLTKAPSQAQFWSQVKEQLQALPLADQRTITKVLLAGESVIDPNFLDTLKEALQEVTGGVNLTFHREQCTHVVTNQVFAAARGAALYARWRQEAPYECVEKDECYEKRRREREGIGNGKVERK